ncbi:MAG: stage 0 sporulation family protein [Armatimonadota bacterium]|nr:stage 0 sporulation family protein [bacterium]
MPLVVGVTFRKVGKVYYFDPGELPLNEGDFVIAETARGVEFGEVVLEPREISEEELVAPLKKVVRVATGDDLQREASNRDREKHAYEVCERKIAEHGLPMKLLEAEYAFDGSQVTFSFSADGRIDFRELVKDVAGALKTKVQLHQIGVRDEAKLVGGYGGCGRSLCCATFLSNFEPISMKMAKDQSLFLNPAKFSGVCGKLMCCLRYEHEHYKLSQKQLPAVGAILMLEDGKKAKVVDVNVISNVISVETEEGVQLHIHAGQIKLEGLCRRHGIGCNMAEKNCQRLVVGDSVCSVPDNDEDSDDEIVEELLKSDPEAVSLLDEIVESDSSQGGVTFRTPRQAPSHVDSEKPRTEEKRGNGNGADRSRHRNRNNRNNNRHNKREDAEDAS